MTIIRYFQDQRVLAVLQAQREAHVTGAGVAGSIAECLLHDPKDALLRARWQTVIGRQVPKFCYHLCPGAVAEGLSGPGSDNFWVQLIPSLASWWFLA